TSSRSGRSLASATKQTRSTSSSARSAARCMSSPSRPAPAGSRGGSTRATWGDAGAGGLGTPRDDGHLLADEAVEQGGLPDVGAAYEGHEAGAMGGRAQECGKSTAQHTRAH